MKPIKLVCTDRGQHGSRTLAKVRLEADGALVKMPGHVTRATPPIDDNTSALARAIAASQASDDVSAEAQRVRKRARRSYVSWTFNGCPACTRDIRIDRDVLAQVVGEAARVGLTQVDVSALR